MYIIPAIDIISGKCVRLTKGNYRLKKIYSSDPLKIAKLFEEAGFKKLHLIDLEGAKEGKIKNWGIIEKIAKDTKFLIEFGGGIRNQKDVEKLLDIGIDRVILGSMVFKKPVEFKKIFKKFGPKKIVISLDIRKEKICYHGWQKEARKNIDSFLKNLIKLGIKIIICTDIERDGTLKGPNFHLYEKLIKNFSELELIASGGIKDKEDLSKLSKIGVRGAIIGKAIYEGKIKISQLKPTI